MNTDPELILAGTPFFGSLSPENRKSLSGICLARRLEKREILFREGEKAHAVFLCARGSIQLYRSTPEGQEIVLKVVKPGELFAEVILFERDRYPVSAVALEPGLVYLLPKHQLHCLLEEAEFRRDFIANLMSKLRYLADQMQSLVSDNVETRLFRFLRDQYGGRTKFRISLSKKDVAAAIGTTPETLSRLLLKLKKQGRIEWEGRAVKIGDRD
jgi:CRP/FNR family transcriptional regulator